jgi:type II secretory pathway pseudopilin PulG
MRIARFVSVIVFALTAVVGQQRTAPKKPATLPEALEAAKKAADAEQFGGAIAALQEAIKLLQRQQRAAILASMPKVDGYEVQDDEVDESAEALTGGTFLMTAITRRYNKDDKHISVEVTANSPMLGMLAAMFANPTIIKADGGELVQYGAHKAILKEGKDRDTELQILMHDKHLIKVTAQGLTGDQVLKLFDQAFVDRMEKPLGK